MKHFSSAFLSFSQQLFSLKSTFVYDLVAGMLEYDPMARLTADQALKSIWFDGVGKSCLDGRVVYPKRKITRDEDMIEKETESNKRMKI